MTVLDLRKRPMEDTAAAIRLQAARCRLVASRFADGRALIALALTMERRADVLDGLEGAVTPPP